MKIKIRETRSVCPYCLQSIAAEIIEENNIRYLEKVCPQHGYFQVPIWRNSISMETWCQGYTPLPSSIECPTLCADGLCQYHQQKSCCVLLEVTRRCNLHCRFCFANNVLPDVSLDILKSQVREIYTLGHNPLLQLSGGEPTLRDDLPELIAYAKEIGFTYIQLNTNGIRLAQDPAYVEALAMAGLSIVFLQFDGLQDNVYVALRGKPLLAIKKEAIHQCACNHIGVTLVPTIVRNINDGEIGALIQFVIDSTPSVRGIHFQPVSFFGRYPNEPQMTDRYTLDELVFALITQANLPTQGLLPSRCDHPLCGLHAKFSFNSTGEITSVLSSPSCCSERSSPQRNKEFIGHHWSYLKQSHSNDDSNSFDTFLSNIRQHSFTVTAMAFQDAMNLDTQRLQSCSLHVYSNGSIHPFCAQYLTAFKE